MESKEEDVTLPGAAEPGKAKEIVTLKRAAELCKSEDIELSYRMLRGLVMSKRLPSFRSGTRYYVSMAFLRGAVKDPASQLWNTEK